MQKTNKYYRQSRKAIAINYLAYRWVLAILTYGILAVYDFLKYRNTKFVVSKDSVAFTSGLFSANARRVQYANIHSLSVSQSPLGRLGDYGTVRLHLKDSSTLALKFTEKPTQLSNLLHRLAGDAGASVQSADEYELSQGEIKAQKLAESKAKQAEKYAEKGKCPRCGSINLQPVVEHAVWKGNGWSFTRRMCMNCSKKF